MAVFNFAAIKSVGHFFAKAFKAVAADAPKVITEIEAAKPVVEAVEAATLGANAPVAETVTDLAFAGLGELGSIITTLGTAGEQKLLDVGFDSSVLAEVKAALAKFGSIGKVFAPATK